MPRLWLDRYYTNVLLGGIIWGSSAFLIFPEDSLLHQMILLLFLFAIGFSSLGVLAAKRDLLLALCTGDVWTSALASLFHRRCTLQ